jgi:uncharacterized repeat protein (TIGR01451 family)
MKIFSALIITFALVASMPALAADPLDISLEAYRVVTNADGKQDLVAAKQAKPGDVLEYRAVYRNESSRALRNVVATLPLPEGGMEYLPDAAALKTAVASIDGKSYAALPLKRTVLLANGKREEQLVPANQYRFLRWTLGDLPAGATKTVSARVRIPDLFATPATASR